MQRRTTTQHLHIPAPRPTTARSSRSSRSSSILHIPTPHHPSPPTRPPAPLPRHEALWTTMQRTLSEVETSNTAIFFGPSHARALEDLRCAQIALAQAWMVEPVDAGDGPVVGEEPEHDGLLARKRRLASDAHFQRVAAGVSDVSGKLDDVARAMRGVELESRGVWVELEESEVEGSEMGSVTSTSVRPHNGFSE